jgi:penicillin amidase
MIAGLLVLVLLVGVFGYLYLKQTTLPQTHGRIVLAGLAETVSIQREPSGVVHIQANSKADLFFAQGVVHAQDRLWQMDFQRRVGAGRLSEIFGESALEKDKFLRTWGFYRAADAAYASLSPMAKATIDAYVNGINAYLAAHPPLPLEFKLLAYSPEPWTPSDVIVWAKMMAFNMAENRRTELIRYGLLARGLSQERIAQLMPLYPENGPARLPPPQKPIPLPNEADKKQVEALLALAETLPTFVEASNNWGLGGSRTISGMPLLANDTHLRLGIPSTWHLMHLEAPDYNVIGATLPGLPCVAFGRNTHIAWGVTNLASDVEDLYVLQETDDGSGYIYQNQVKLFQFRSEVFNVKGAQPVELKVRETVYGPVISDVVEIDGAVPLALQWMGHYSKDTTFEAYLALNQAHNWAEFKAALRLYVVPSLNFVYADVEGNIGYLAPGLLPIRKPDHSGLYPMPGNGEWDWQGFIPFEELPQRFNPEQDYIITANHNVTPKNYPYTISLEWGGVPYRAARIEQMVGSREKHSIADMLTMQQDTISLLYKDFMPIIAMLKPSSARGREWRKRLLAWDGNVSADSVEATVFHSWYIGLSGISKPETGKEYWHRYPRYLKNLNAMQMQNSDVACDALKMTCLQYATQVLEQVLTGWGNEILPWGQLHQASFKHPVLTHTPLAFLFDRKMPFGGDRFTVNVGWYNPKNFIMTHGATYRQVVDLGDMENSRYMHFMGQSGHIMSSQYDDLLPLWQKGEYLLMKIIDYPIKDQLWLEPMSVLVDE